ncbi:hypothetical protein HHI36_010695 [Cryptolaemus montrouzieri]|uniref:Uncharacterized protein n=1 Tax=Cryptolaemus montrouzieri TaxID=559131 RepID=A0ABD2MJH8_9CUCU
MGIRAFKVFFFIFRKKFYNPSDTKDAEEILNFLEQLSSDNECYDQVDESEALHLTLFPPEDGADSNQDDGPSGDDEMCRIGDIGKGVLKQKMDVTWILKGEKQALIGPGSRNFTTDLFSSEDEVPLAELLRPEKKEATTTKKGMEGSNHRTNRRKNNYK